MNSKFVLLLILFCTAGIAAMERPPRPAAAEPPGKRQRAERALVPRNTEGMTPAERLLLESAARGDLEGVRQAFDLGADDPWEPQTRFEYNWPHQRHNALYFATINHHPAIIEFLLNNDGEESSDRGIYPDTSDQRPIDIRLLDASARGDVNIVREALAAGANPNIADDYDLTPLFFAVLYRRFDILELLLRAGANINYEEDNEGQTPLDFALDENDEDMVLALLNYRPKPDEDALAYIIRWADHNGHLRVIRHLVRFGVDINPEIVNRAFNGYPPLIMAALQDNINEIKRLLDQGIEHEKIIDALIYSLLQARENAAIELMRFLIQRGYSDKAYQPLDVLERTLRTTPFLSPERRQKKMRIMANCCRIYFPPRTEEKSITQAVNQGLEVLGEWSKISDLTVRERENLQAIQALLQRLLQAERSAIPLIMNSTLRFIRTLLATSRITQREREVYLELERRLKPPLVHALVRRAIDILEMNLKKLSTNAYQQLLLAQQAALTERENYERLLVMLDQVYRRPVEDILRDVLAFIDARLKDQNLKPTDRQTYQELRRLITRAGNEISLVDILPDEIYLKIMSKTLGAPH